MPNYEIVETEYEIPFYRSQNEMLKKYDSLDYDRYEFVSINESEIPYIIGILRSQISEDSKATEKIIKNICKYNMQIAGVYDKEDKTKKIYINFFCGDYTFDKKTNEKFKANPKGQRMRFVMVSDGGDCYFQAEINTKDNTLRIIYVNGVA